MRDLKCVDRVSLAAVGVFSMEKSAGVSAVLDEEEASTKEEVASSESKEA